MTSLYEAEVQGRDTGWRWRHKRCQHEMVSEGRVREIMGRRRVKREML